MRRQMKLMMHEMEEKEWELADEILKESRRRQNPGDLSRDELSEQFGYVTNVQKVLIKHQNKVDAEEKAKKEEMKAFEVENLR